MTSKPNFLYIMTDQHRADWLGCAGHPVVKTPHIDALAKDGVRFTDFHVASPVCMPNRASFMTGRFPTTHGLRYNGCTLPSDTNTFVDVLKAGGYRTASIGKSHLQPFTDGLPHDWGDVTGPIKEARSSDESDYGKEEPGRYQSDEEYLFPTPYYGFDHVTMVTGHGDRAGGHYQQWFRQTHPDWQDLLARENELPHNYSCPQAFRTPVSEDAYSTAYIRDRAKDYLAENAGSDSPFFAFVSFPDPHHPFNPPGKYWDLYGPEAFDLRTRYADHRNPPVPLEAARRAMESGETPMTLQTAFMTSDQSVREAMALTAGMIAMIDDAVGEIVDVLKNTGQFDNTVIVFNSDHGDYLGDFNMMLKGAWASETISHVPFIWRDPDASAGRETAALASTIDIPATILDRAGLHPYVGMQGRSFLDCLTGADAHRDNLLVEYNDGLARSGFSQPARVRSVMTADWRLTFYGNLDWGELYDRNNDPLATNNLWSDAAYGDRKAQLMQLLVDQLIGLMDESPRANRLA